MTYEEWEAQLIDQHEHERECGATHTTKGADPWGFTCELDKGHTGKHRQHDGFGPGTGDYTWY